MDQAARVAPALHQLARGLEMLADALVGELDPMAERQLAVLRDWGNRGLSREEASALFRGHGFAAQTSGGWARGGWIECRSDGLRYLTARSLHWAADQEDKK